MVSEINFKQEIANFIGLALLYVGLFVQALLIPEYWIGFLIGGIGFLFTAWATVFRLR